MRYVVDNRRSYESMGHGAWGMEHGTWRPEDKKTSRPVDQETRRLKDYKLNKSIIRTEYTSIWKHYQISD